MHQKLILAGAPPHADPILGELTAAPPDPLELNLKGPTSEGGEGKGIV